jgi:hypothetical protein
MTKKATEEALLQLILNAETYFCVLWASSPRVRLLCTEVKTHPWNSSVKMTAMNRFQPAGAVNPNHRR